MNKLLIIILAFFAASCVTSADLQRLTDAQGVFEVSTAQALTDVSLDAKEKIAAVDAANKVRVNAAEDVMEDVKRRTQAMIETAKTGPMGIASGLVEALMLAVVTGGVAKKATMMARDKQSQSTYNKPAA